MPEPSALLRRWHARAGGIALTAFLVLHLLSNATALRGQASYERIAGALQRSSLLPLLEIAIFVPLLFHAGYGLYLLRTRQDEEAAIARWGDRGRWTLQRVSAVVLLVFAAGHVMEMRLAKTVDFHSTLSAHLSWTWKGVPWIGLAYVAGVAAAAVHAANGRARRRGQAFVLGGVLFLVGAATVLGFATGTLLLPAAEVDSPCGTAR